jgi:hypothetical protein
MNHASGLTLTARARSGCELPALLMCCASRRGPQSIVARGGRHTDGRQARNERSEQVGYSHQVPNLGMLGRSSMGSHAERNPTLAIQVLAWPTTEHLMRKWDRTRA